MQVRRLARKISLTLVGLVVLTGTCVLLGALPLPAGASADDAKQHRIYILSNGFHSDIALPADIGFERLPVSPVDFPVTAEEIEYLAIGWGSKTAYTSLRKVSDLTIPIVAKSYALDRTVVHVQPLGDLRPADKVFAYDLTDEQLDVLASEIAAAFASPDPMPELTQGFGDRFYEGKGRFTPFHSCNTWVGYNLRNIGIGVGLWPVTAQTLEFGLKQTSLNRQLEP